MSNHRPPFTSAPFTHQTYAPNPASNYPNLPLYQPQNYLPNNPYPPPHQQQQQQQQQQQPQIYFPPQPPAVPLSQLSFPSTPSSDSRGIPQYPSFSTAQPYTTPQDLQGRAPPNPIPQQLPHQNPYWQHHHEPPHVHAPVRREITEAVAKQNAEAVFERFDGDKSGYLDLQEFMDALRALHLSIGYHDALESFAQCDANEDGRIGKDEFVAQYIRYINEMRGKRNMY